jgi:ABC-type methionine transport system permease subunit
MRNSLLIPISQRLRRFLLGGPELKNAISQTLAGLFDFLHLLANSCSRGLVTAFGLADVAFDFSYQRLKSFILLHLIVLHFRKGYCVFRVQTAKKLKAGNAFVKEKRDFCKKNSI